MRTPEKLCDAALAVTLLLAGCGGSKQSAETAKPASAPTQAPAPAPAPEYAPGDGTFVIKAQKPEIRSYGNMTEYIFYGPDKHGFSLLHLSIIVFGPSGSGTPPPVSLDQYERSYASLPGAVVSSKDIAQGTYAGRELSVTGQRPPLMVRIYSVNGRTYLLEWNPTVAHSTETADTFEIP
jgi:hypothetical protein